MATEDSSLSAMIKLTASNYAIWNLLMENLLYCKDLYDSLENKGKKLNAMNDAECKKSNRKTIGHIKQWIDHSVFHHIA